MTDVRPFESKGEHLASYLHHNFLGYGNQSWGDLGRILLPSNRADEWVEAFQEMAVLQLSRRLISAGKAIHDQYDQESEAIVEREIKDMIFDTMTIDYSHVNDIFIRLKPAIHSSRTRIKDGLRRRIRRQASREMTYCYLCGTKLDFITERADNYATIDHVWPRAYGGDSVYDNLLIACCSCNNLKASTPSWAMYHIQSLVVGHADKIEELPKWTRLAIRTREARKTAVSKNISLREAFLNLELTNELVAASIGAIDGFSLNISSP